MSMDRINEMFSQQEQKMFSSVLPKSKILYHGDKKLTGYFHSQMKKSSMDLQESFVEEKSPFPYED